MDCAQALERELCLSYAWTLGLPLPHSDSTNAIHLSLITIGLTSQPPLYFFSHVRGSALCQPNRISSSVTPDRCSFNDNHQHDHLQPLDLSPRLRQG